MKIRHGFISNSSSSSFVVIARTPKVKQGFTFLDMLRPTFHRDRVDKDLFVGNIDEYVDTLKRDIEDLEKEIEWATKEIDVFKDALKNEDAINLLARASYIQDRVKQDEAFERVYYGNARKHITNRICGLKVSLDSMNKKISEYKDELVKATPYIGKDDWSVLKFTVDNYYGMETEINEWMKQDGAFVTKIVRT